MDAWPLISKSGQNMCKGRAEGWPRLAGGTGGHCSSSESTAAQGAVHPGTWQSPESSFQTLPTEPLYQSAVEKCHSYVKHFREVTDKLRELSESGLRIPGVGPRGNSSVLGKGSTGEEALMAGSSSVSSRPRGSEKSRATSPGLTCCGHFVYGGHSPRQTRGSEHPACEHGALCPMWTHTAKARRRFGTCDLALLDRQLR